jgi:hypothetical protein
VVNTALGMRFVIDVFSRRDVGWQTSLRQLGIEITSYRW